MRHTIFRDFRIAAALAIALSTAPAAFSAVIVGNVVSGTVSAVQGYQITVNGQTYTVQSTGQALTQLQQVQTGEQVDLVLNGPPGAPNTVVVAIHVRPAS